MAIIFAVIALAESAVRLGWISSFFLAAPTRAAVVLWEQIVHGNALWLTAITLFEIGACLLISTVVGVLAGFLLWRFRLIGTSYEMFLAALFSSPVILAYPIFLVTFGRTSAAVIACRPGVRSQPSSSSTSNGNDAAVNAGRSTSSTSTNVRRPSGGTESPWRMGVEWNRHHSPGAPGRLPLPQPARLRAKARSLAASRCTPSHLTQEPNTSQTRGGAFAGCSARPFSTWRSSAFQQVLQRAPANQR